MNYRTSCYVVLVLVFSAAASSAADRPNVVLIVCDDLNTDIGHLGGHPQARTPNIDRLAGSGVSFRRAYSNNPICAPSRSSFLTGIYPHTSGNLFWGKWFENDTLANSKTVMEHFRDNGYAVVGSGKLMHHFKREVWDEFAHQADYGPMAFDGKQRVGHPSVPEPFRSIGPVDGSFAPLSDVPFGGRDGKGWIYGRWNETQPFRYISEDDRSPTPDERNAQWAAERIRRFAESGADRPFFLAVGFIRPHTPLHVPKKYFDMFPLETLELPVIKTEDADDCHYRDVFHDDVKGLRYYATLGKSYPTIQGGLKAFLQAYLACVAAVDDQIGVILDAVDRSGLRDNTIIIVTSDHGWHNGQREYLFKNSLWEESTRAPFIVCAPGVTEPGGIAEHPIALIDLYPTLVDLCNLKGDTRKNDRGGPLDGHSVRPFLEDPTSRDWAGPDGALTMVFAGGNSKTGLTAADLKNPAKQHWSLRTERWRYVLYNNGAEELYDHAHDPHEWTNLAEDPDCVSTKRRLKEKLLRMSRAEPGHAPPATDSGEHPTAARAARITLSALVTAGLSAQDAKSGGEWDIPKDPSKFHIFVCLGQSNMAGGFKESHLYNDDGQYDPVTDPVPRVLVYRAGGWRPAAHPLIKHNKVSFSLPIPFAKKYLELLDDPDVKVGLVTSAYGGKQIGFFVKGNAMYPGGLNRLKETGTFKGILWHQGESNTTGVDRYVSFKPCLLGIVRDIRSDLDMPRLPFVTGQLTRMSSNSIPQKDHFGSESCGTITRVLADIGDYVDDAAHVRSSNCGLCVEHTRHLVDEAGNPTGKTIRMPDNTVHFNRSGLTTMGHRYARAILDYPSFKNDPVRLLAVPGREIDASLVCEVSDLSKDRLTFAAKELPDWLTIKPDGSVSGTPPAVGEYKGKLTVTDESGRVDKSDLVVHVQEGVAPVFKDNAFKRSPVIAGLEFKNGVRYAFHKTWSSELYEPNNDTLTFSKVDGPDWLTVSSDGMFSGVPAASDAGTTVTFKVKVADADGEDTADYSMEVFGDEMVWFDRFDYLPDIRSLQVDETFELSAKSPRDVYFPSVSTRNTKHKISDLFISIGASGYKFGRGSLKSFSILLDGRRFGGTGGDYRFRFRQYGIGKYAHVIVSIYGVEFGESPEAAVTVRWEGKQFYAVPAPVTARGGAKLRKLAEKNYRDTPEAGSQELDFEYEGMGDVLLVFSASVKPEDLDKIETVKLSRSQKRKKQRELGGIYPPAFQETGAELDDFSITRVLER